MLDKFFFPLFGCFHSLLIHDLALQTTVLGVIEVAYFVAKLLSLRVIGFPRYNK